MATKNRFTPELVDLVEIAALSAFWWMKPFQRFLNQCGVADKYTRKQHDKETKRELLNRLLTSLVKTDAGKAVIIRMATYLSEMDSFPGLHGIDDIELKRKEAESATKILKDYLEKQKKVIVDKEKQEKAKKEYRELQENIKKSKQSLDKLKDRFTNDICPLLGTQKAGYCFETFFYDLLDFYEVENRRPYKDANQRQIDGSFTMESTTYLVELKFTTTPIGPKDITDFDGKLRTKAENTLGIFLSMSGFTDGAIGAASRDRTPIFLLDHSHLYLILEADRTPHDIVNKIRKFASQSGSSFLLAKHF